MRSRYAGYSLGKVDYILATQIEPADRESVARFCELTRFVGLEIVDTTPGEREAYVTFRAALEQGGVDASFTERSRFLKQDDRWLYADGERIP